MSYSEDNDNESTGSVELPEEMADIGDNITASMADVIEDMEEEEKTNLMQEKLKSEGTPEVKPLPQSSDTFHSSRLSLLSGKSAARRRLEVSRLNAIPPEITIKKKQPYLTIVEQPQARGYRFRYRCEGPAHGGLQGERSTKTRRTYPTVKINDYEGPARVVLALVTDNDSPELHVHELVGKYCKDGKGIMDIQNSSKSCCSFQGVGVQHVTKKDLCNVLAKRIREKKEGAIEMEEARSLAYRRAKTMRLNCVRLRFEAFIEDSFLNVCRRLEPVYSQTIFDSKSVSANLLKICRVDRHVGVCTGGEEVFLLCEKIQKEDISVIFVEYDEAENEIWKAYGDFSQVDVHRQFAVVFKTPPYRDVQITVSKEVRLYLERRSDGMRSDPVIFTYKPAVTDLEEIYRKRLKNLPSFVLPHDS